MVQKGQLRYIKKQNICTQNQLTEGLNYLDWLLNSKKRAQENNFSEAHNNFSQ
ncbi:hypothetical protein PsalSR1_04411 (plasmid) [Piscirickettsia salmonis]|nr:hypothetical protein PsalSR1_04411 [Piscirickettsia salmonis]